MPDITLCVMLPPRGDTTFDRSAHTKMPVLRGAEETLLRCHPVVIVEQKPGHAQRFGFGETEAVDYLQSLGATLKARKAGDFILSFH